MEVLAWGCQAVEPEVQPATRNVCGTGVCPQHFDLHLALFESSPSLVPGSQDLLAISVRHIEWSFE